MNPAGADYRPRITALHRELGIPADYATTRRLALQLEADERKLVPIAFKPDGSSVRLLPGAAQAWIKMQHAAQTDGIELRPLSGFRSVARQVTLIRAKLMAGQPIADILTVIAAPGYSEHHTARALDLGTASESDLEESFAQTPAYQWLHVHAERYGFHLSYPLGNLEGFVFEPWHWSWNT